MTLMELTEQESGIVVYDWTDKSVAVMNWCNAGDDMIPLLSDIKNNIAALSLGCDRVTELEHAADDAYEDYIGFIFQNVDDVKALIKYKNLAEMLENATDAHKRISDNVRRLLLRYLSV